MDKMNPVEKGRKGEDIAAQYLINKGFSILERNFKRKGGEIDIIALKGELLLFVEVKTCYSPDSFDPAEWVDPAKQKRIIQTALRYSLENQIENCSFRFDVITLGKRGGLFNLNHYEGAFSPGLSQDDDHS